MLLHRIHLNPRCREARRDLADPYQMHASLCRAFALPEQKSPVGEFLWRLEPELGAGNLPRVLVQSRSAAAWDRIGVSDWLTSADSPIDLQEKLRLDSLDAGKRFRFRLRANPCVTRNHKRIGLLRTEDQEAWIARKGALHGFEVPILRKAEEADKERFDVRVSQERLMRGKQHGGNEIRVFSVLFDGTLTVTDSGKFVSALKTGIGHAKALGLGLLSVVPIG